MASIMLESDILFRGVEIGGGGIQLSEKTFYFDILKRYLESFLLSVF